MKITELIEGYREAAEKVDADDKIREWVYSWERNSDGRDRWNDRQSRPDIDIKDGKIIAHRDIDFSSFQRTDGRRFKKFEYPFETVDGHLTLTNSDLESLEGSPNLITASLYLNGCKLKNFEHAPQIIGGGLVLGSQRGGLDSLKDIHKHFGTVHGSIIVGGSFKKNFLGLLMIGPSSIRAGISKAGLGEGMNERTKLALNILDEVLQEHGSGKQAVLIAQDKLMDEDLDDYAEL